MCHESTSCFIFIIKCNDSLRAPSKFVEKIYIFLLQFYIISLFWTSIPATLEVAVVWWCYQLELGFCSLALAKSNCSGQKLTNNNKINETTNPNNGLRWRVCILTLFGFLCLLNACTEIYIPISLINSLQSNDKMISS